MPVLVELVQPPTNADLVSGLERLLEQAKTGEIIGIAYVALCPSQVFRVSKIGFCSNLEMAGALAFAQFDMIKSAG